MIRVGPNTLLTEPPGGGGHKRIDCRFCDKIAAIFGCSRQWVFEGAASYTDDARQPVKKEPLSHGTRRLITVFTTAPRVISRSFGLTAAVRSEVPGLGLQRPPRYPARS